MDDASRDPIRSPGPRSTRGLAEAWTRSRRTGSSPGQPIHASGTRVARETSLPSGRRTATNDGTRRAPVIDKLASHVWGPLSSTPGGERMAGLRSVLVEAPPTGRSTASPGQHRAADRRSCQPFLPPHVVADLHRSATTGAVDGTGLACIGLHRPASACIGLHRPASACIGLHRPAPACTGWHRPAPAGTGRHRPAPAGTAPERILPSDLPSAKLFDRTPRAPPPPELADEARRLHPAAGVSVAPSTTMRLAPSSEP